MLLTLGLQAFGVGRNAPFRLGDQLLLALRERGELVPDGTLGALQVVPPGREPRCHLVLSFAQRLSELVSGSSRALCGGRPPLLRHAALLLRQERDRVRAGARKRPVELHTAFLRFAGDEHAEPRLRACELLVETVRGTQDLAELHGRELRSESERDPGRSHGDAPFRPQAERDPGRRCREPEHDGTADYCRGAGARSTTTPSSDSVARAAAATNAIWAICSSSTAVRLRGG